MMWLIDRFRMMLCKHDWEKRTVNVGSHRKACEPYTYHGIVDSWIERSEPCLPNDPQGVFVTRETYHRWHCRKCGYSKRVKA